ncbi:hypothetical protein Ahy_A08g038258 isoform B [Arachis hypogaea]|uniref:Uncharacterized protein n=1 Tax=Arachis hypogaea TaxID=3818 RepID=A0A445BSY3_ARAHY|nr:hypothetical protein Ahy_A08g038258 isoform B [Arachis hypogaea]
MELTLTYTLVSRAPFTLHTSEELLPLSVHALSVHALLPSTSFFHRCRRRSRRTISSLTSATTIRWLSSSTGSGITTLILQGRSLPLVVVEVVASSLFSPLWAHSPPSCTVSSPSNFADGDSTPPLLLRRPGWQLPPQLGPSRFLQMCQMEIQVFFSCVFWNERLLESLMIVDLAVVTVLRSYNETAFLVWEGHEFQYQDELAKLVVSLECFFRFDVPAQTSRDTKETLLKVTRILSAVRKLPLARTESATGSASDLDSMPLESDVCGTLPLQLNDEKDRELDSTEESAELECLAKPILEDIASLVQKGSQAEAEIHKGHQVLQSKHEGSGRLRSIIEFFGSRMDFTVSDSIVFNENNLIAEDISNLEDAFKQLLSFFILRLLLHHQSAVDADQLEGSVTSLSNLDDSDSSKYLVRKKVQESLENLKEEAVVPKRLFQEISDVTFTFCRKMGLWTLLEGFLLLANALAILNEDRFLAPRGWGLSDFSSGRTKSFKDQLIAIKKRMEKDIDEVRKIAHGVKTKIEAINKDVMRQR